MSIAKDLGCIILAAGDGTRLKSSMPKALHQVCGKPIIVHVLSTLADLPLRKRVIVVGYQREQIQAAFEDDPVMAFAVQEERLGTGHAVMAAREQYQGFCGDVLVVSGDTPLIRAATIRKLVERHRHQDAAATVLTADLPDPEGYGRILRNPDDTVLGIREHKDANIYELKITEVNTGTYVFDSMELFPSLDQITPDNKQHEYYLTDVIQVLVKEDKRVEGYLARDPTETMGVNSRIQLAEAERILRQRIRERHMLAGVSLLDPASTFIDESVEIGRDTIIYPNTYLWGRTTIGGECRIGPQTQLCDCRVGDRAVVNAVQIVDVDVGEGEQIGPMVVKKTER